MLPRYRGWCFSRLALSMDVLGDEAVAPEAAIVFCLMPVRERLHVYLTAQHVLANAPLGRCSRALMRVSFSSMEGRRNTRALHAALQRAYVVYL